MFTVFFLIAAQDLIPGIFQNKQVYRQIHPVDAVACTTNPKDAKDYMSYLNVPLALSPPPISSIGSHHIMGYTPYADGILLEHYLTTPQKKYRTFVANKSDLVQVKASELDFLCALYTKRKTYLPAPSSLTPLGTDILEVTISCLEEHERVCMGGISKFFYDFINTERKGIDCVRLTHPMAIRRLSLYPNLKILSIEDTYNDTVIESLIGNLSYDFPSSLPALNMHYIIWKNWFFTARLKILPNLVTIKIIEQCAKNPQNEIKEVAHVDPFIVIDIGKYKVVSSWNVFPYYSQIIKMRVHFMLLRGRHFYQTYQLVDWLSVLRKSDKIITHF